METEPTEAGRRRLLQNVSSASEANETTHTKKVVGGEVVPHMSYDDKTETLHQKYTEKSFVNGTNSSVAGTKYTNEKDVEFGSDSIATVVDKTTIVPDADADPDDPNAMGIEALGTVATKATVELNSAARQDARAATRSPNATDVMNATAQPGDEEGMRVVFEHAENRTEEEVEIDPDDADLEGFGKSQSLSKFANESNATESEIGSGEMGSGDFGSGEDLDAFLPDDEGMMRRLTDGTVEDPAENEHNALMSDLISAENASAQWAVIESHSDHSRHLSAMALLDERTPNANVMFAATSYTKSIIGSPRVIKIITAPITVLSYLCSDAVKNWRYRDEEMALRAQVNFINKMEHRSLDGGVTASDPTPVSGLGRNNDELLYGTVTQGSRVDRVIFFRGLDTFNVKSFRDWVSELAHSVSCAEMYTGLARLRLHRTAILTSMMSLFNKCYSGLRSYLAAVRRELPSEYLTGANCVMFSRGTTLGSAYANMFPGACKYITMAGSPGVVVDARMSDNTVTVLNSEKDWVNEKVPYLSGRPGKPKGHRNVFCYCKHKIVDYMQCLRKEVVERLNKCRTNSNRRQLALAGGADVHVEIDFGLNLDGSRKMTLFNKVKDFEQRVDRVGRTLPSRSYDRTRGKRWDKTIFSHFQPTPIGPVRFAVNTHAYAYSSLRYGVSVKWWDPNPKAYAYARAWSGAGISGEAALWLWIVMAGFYIQGNAFRASVSAGTGIELKVTDGGNTDVCAGAGYWVGLPSAEAGLYMRWRNRCYCRCRRWFRCRCGCNWGGRKILARIFSIRMGSTYKRPDCSFW